MYLLCSTRICRRCSNPMVCLPHGLPFLSRSLTPDGIHTRVTRHRRSSPTRLVVCFVDRLDAVLAEKTETTPQKSARPAQPGEMEVPLDLLQVPDLLGGGGWTRTNDLRIMRPSL